jgi:excisionase family DNA binding protein
VRAEEVLERLLKPKEVAILLNINVKTVYLWVYQSYIPYIKLAKTVRFKEEAIKNWVEANSFNNAKKSGKCPHKNTEAI